MSHKKWSDVKFYFTGDEYFSSVIESIQQALIEVRVEMYLFNFDELGKKVLQSLKEARERGVKVYLIVDGIGTIGCLAEIDDFCQKNNIHFKVYHSLPLCPYWLRRFSFQAFTWKSVHPFFLSLRKMNSRDHRKIFLIDQKTAYLGSQNIDKCHSETLSKAVAWRDTGVRLEGVPIKTLVQNSQSSWQEAKANSFKNALSFKLNVLHLSARRRHRLARTRKLVQSFNEAQSRIWITTAYFIPNRKILWALACAAKRGVSVAVILPAKSDIAFMKWTAWLLYERLLNAGVKIYEYQDRVLHAKSMIVDSWATVGSYNFNHRSLIHDLEVEAIIDSPKWLEVLVVQWFKDIQDSQLVLSKENHHANIFTLVIANVFYFFRYWI